MKKKLVKTYENLLCAKTTLTMYLNLHVHRDYHLIIQHSHGQSSINESFLIEKSTVNEPSPMAMLNYQGVYI